MINQELLYRQTLTMSSMFIFWMSLQLPTLHVHTSQAVRIGACWLCINSMTIEHFAAAIFTNNTDVHLMHAFQIAAQYAKSKVLAPSVADDLTFNYHVIASGDVTAARRIGSL